MNSMPDFLDNFEEYNDFTSPGMPQNGRVNFLERKSAGGSLGTAYNGFLFSATNPEPGFQDDMIKGNLEESPLSQAYFSAKNMKIIQNSIRYSIYERSGKKWIIDPQSTDELKIIMRAIFYENARHLSDNISWQIQELDKKVIDWIVPKVFMEIKQYYHYLNDISKMPSPISHPISMSSAGTRTPKNPVFFESMPDIPIPNDNNMPRFMPMNSMQF
jgi:hypothetical protein